MSESNVWENLLNSINYSIISFSKKNYTDDISILKIMFALEWACKSGNNRCRNMATNYLEDIPSTLL